MPFPNLTLRAGGVLLAEATGVPSNGANTFEHGIAPGYVNEDWLNVEIVANGASVQAATYGSLSSDKRSITINFTQVGIDTASVTAWVTHSRVR